MQTEKARFDTRLPMELKDLFEYAARIGGFRTLSEFLISSAKQSAESIIDKHNAIIASKRDQEIFFHALLHPNPPGKKLKTAAQRYKKAVAGK